MGDDKAVASAWVTLERLLRLIRKSSVPRREVRCSGVNIKGTTTLIICFFNGQILYKILSEELVIPSIVSISVCLSSRATSSSTAASDEHHGQLDDSTPLLSSSSCFVDHTIIDNIASWIGRWPPSILDGGRGGSVG